MRSHKVARFLLVPSYIVKSLVLLVLLVVFCSCNIKDDKNIPLAEQELPDMILKDATYTLGKPNEEPLTMKARSITIYNNEKGTLMDDVSFTSGNKLQGSCDKASVSSDSNKATLEGNVKIFKNDDNISIQAQSLRWDNDKMTIDTDGEVFVSYEDGTQIRAKGFAAQLDINLYEFSEIIEGRFEE